MVTAKYTSAASFFMFQVPAQFYYFYINKCVWPAAFQSVAPPANERGSRHAGLVSEMIRTQILNGRT